MGFNFPSSPAEGQEFEPLTGVVYVYHSPKWTAKPVEGGSGGGGATLTISDVVPGVPADGMLWWESDTGILWLRYNDGNTTQFVEIGGGSATVSKAYVDAADTIHTDAIALKADKTYVDSQDALKANITYVDSQVANKVAKGGDTMTGHLSLPITPAAANAVRKDYVDAADALKADKTYVDTQDTSKVAKAGDTMTGNLNVVGATSIALTLGSNAPAGGGALDINWAQNGKYTFTLRNGGDLVLYRYNDAGVYVDNAIAFTRANGLVTVTNAMTVNGVLTVGNDLKVNGLIRTGGVASLSTIPTYYFQDAAGLANYAWIDYNISSQTFAIHATGYVITMVSSGRVELARGLSGKAGMDGAFSGYVMNFNSDGSGMQGWLNGSYLGFITFSSDYRIKKDVIDLPGMWDTVKALRPIKYTQADFTPPAEVARRVKDAATAKKNKTEIPDEDKQPLFIADNVERWGFIAHELQETLIGSAASSVKDAPDAVQSPNPWTVIAALTKTLQEAMARIEALEAKVGV